MRYVARNGAFAWRHALEMQPSDVDCTDMSDSQFEVYVMETTRVTDAMVQAFISTWYRDTGAALQPSDVPELRNALMAAMTVSEHVIVPKRKTEPVISRSDIQEAACMLRELANMDDDGGGHPIPVNQRDEEALRMADHLTYGSDFWPWSASEEVIDASSKETIDSRKWKELVMSADDLLGTAWSAALKMRLSGRGSDCGLPHEVRMFALHFSPEGTVGPGALQVTGAGTFLAWRRLARAVISEAAA